MRACFPLSFPQLAVGINDSVSKQVPGALLDEIALGEYALILEDVLENARIVDYDARVKGGHCDLESLETEVSLTLDEPCKELFAVLQEY